MLSKGSPKAKASPSQTQMKKRKSDKPSDKSIPAFYA